MPQNIAHILTSLISMIYRMQAAYQCSE